MYYDMCYYTFYFYIYIYTHVQIAMVQNIGPTRYTCNTTLSKDRQPPPFSIVQKIMTRLHGPSLGKIRRFTRQISAEFIRNSLEQL